MEITKKINGDLILEVTQKCNFSCAHCLRGPARNQNMSKETVDRTLDNFEHISSITFTGGEPLLNADIIIYTLRQIRERGISLGSFYIVTNGSIRNHELFFELIETYKYCDEREMCGLCVSVDDYHDYQDSDIYFEWSCLNFFKKDKEQSFEYGLLNRGNAYENGIGTKDFRVIDFCGFDDGYLENYIYINAEGKIYFDCDLSYDMCDEIDTVNIHDVELFGYLEEMARHKESAYA